MKVFLGGTCDGSQWREELIPLLKIDYFNPVVEDWTPEAQVIEEEEKSGRCDTHLYVITKEIKGVYSIAEAVESSHNRRKVTIFYVVPEGLEEHMLKSLKAVGKIIQNNDGIFRLGSIEDLAKVINEV